MHAPPAQTSRRQGSAGLAPPAPAPPDGESHLRARARTKPFAQSGHPAGSAAPDLRPGARAPQPVGPRYDTPEESSARAPSGSVRAVHTARPEELGIPRG
ncbi:hypothetical protein GCM10027174_31890 [Salinifilum aidingensis]